MAGKQKLLRLYTKLSTIALLGLLCVSGVLVAGSGPSWHTFKGDPQHTGQSPFNGGEVNTLRWNFPAGQRISSSPVVGPDGTVYVGSYDAALYAINPDGTQKWQFKAKEIIDSSPAIGPDGTIYFGSWDHNLYAVRPDGKGMWMAVTSDRISSSPTVGPDGTVYVGSDNGFLYAVSPTGSMRWSFQTGDRIFSSAALAPDGTIYVGSFDNNLYAINPDGTQKWRFATGNFVFSSPAIGSDGTIYVGSYDNNLYAINPDGTEKWKFATGGIVQVSPSIAPDGTIYVGSFDNNLYAINPDGTEKWKFQTGDLVVSSPAIDADGTIYFGSVDKSLYAINPDGTQKWRFETNARIFSSPAIGPDGTIYVGSVDGNLYAIGEPLVLSGAEFPISGSVYESVGYAGTQLYVADVTKGPESQGMKSVVIEVVLKNNGVYPRSFDLSAFKLKDLDGNEYAPDQSKSTLKDVRIQAGDTLRGILSFEVPTETEAGLLIYQDVRGARLNVNLGSEKSPPSAVPGSALEPGSNKGKKIVVNKIEFTILDERFDASSGQYVVRVSLKNISGNAVAYDQAHAYAKDVAGNVYTPREGEFRGELEPGQSVKGDIVFEAPGDIDRFIFVYDDEGLGTMITVPEFPLHPILIAGSVSMVMALVAYRLGRRNPLLQ